VLAGKLEHGACIDTCGSGLRERAALPD
jgi:hypothetical protein